LIVLIPTTLVLLLALVKVVNAQGHLGVEDELLQLGQLGKMLIDVFLEKE
jgi:hypothetical protein